MFRIVLTIICADGKETTENMKKMKKNWVEISKLKLMKIFKIIKSTIVSYCLIIKYHSKWINEKSSKSALILSN